MYCDQARIDQLKAEIASLGGQIIKLESRVSSYTVNGRQVTLKATGSLGDELPALRKLRDGLLVDLARCEAGGIQIFYGVPRW